MEHFLDLSLHLCEFRLSRVDYTRVIYRPFSPSFKTSTLLLWMPPGRDTERERKIDRNVETRIIPPTKLFLFLREEIILVWIKTASSFSNAPKTKTRKKNSCLVLGVEKKRKHWRTKSRKKVNKSFSQIKPVKYKRESDSLREFFDIWTF